MRCSNAFIFPVTYFFYPETAYRSLEEMDRIFRKTKSIFSLVRTAKEEPHMYGKHGELMRQLSDVEDEAVRRASYLEHHAGKKERESSDETSTEKVDKVEHVN